MKKRLLAAVFAVYLLVGVSAPCLASEILEETEIRQESSFEEVASSEESGNSETSSSLPVPKQKTDEVVNETEKPGFFEKMQKNFYNTFVRDSRWKLFLEGFGNTIFIALCSTVLGVFIGMIVALIKVFKVQSDKPNFFVNVLNAICNLYTTLIRGTPAVVQLFIAYYIIFKHSDSYVFVSIFAFGVNSGAYVSEIIRGGIMSIDKGQLEAGRSLGLSHLQTMISVIFPQAIKNILPALGNEFILLLKDTSIAGYIGTLELMKAGNIVRSRTFEPYFSLLSVAGVYLVCVILLEQLLKYFERRLAKSDRH